MITIQELIHRLEVGEGARYLKLAGIVLGLIGLTVVHDIREYRNFSSQEAMDFAQLARNISEGKGYQTQFIRPFSVYLIQQHQGDRYPHLQDNHPDLANAPVYPGLLAGWMKLLPFNYPITMTQWFEKYQPEMLICVLNQIFFFLAIFLVFRTAKNLFNNTVAWVSAILFAATEQMWQFSLSGLPTLFLMLVVLGIAGCLVALKRAEDEDKHGRFWYAGMALLTGGLMAVGALTRYSVGWLLLPVLAFIFIFLRRRCWMLATVAVVSFLLVLSPWLTRNYAVCGHLFGSAGYALVEETKAFSGNTLGRSIEPDLSQVSPTDTLRKLLVNLALIIGDQLPRYGGNWFCAFFLVGLLLPLRSPVSTSLRWFLVIAIVVLAVVQALGQTHISRDFPVINTENLLILLFPLVLIFGVAMFSILLEQIDFSLPELRHLLVGGVMLVASAPLVFKLLPPREYPADSPYYPPIIQQAGLWMEPKELMMSDMPWAVAWYGQRPCMWYTLTVKPEFYTVNKSYAPVNALYLTSLTSSEGLPSQLLQIPDSWSWFVMEATTLTNVPSGFPLTHAQSDFLPDQFFLSDRKRW